MKKLPVLFAFLVVLSLVLAACGTPAPAPTATTAPEVMATDTTAPDQPAMTDTPAPADTATVAPTPTDPAPDVLGSGTTKIVIWHRWEGEYYKAIKQIFADYATKNNIQIELLLVQNVADKAQLAIPSGQGPDIIAWVNDRVGDSALSGIIQPLTQYGVDEKYLRSNFTDVATDAVLYNKEAYGIPESMEAMTLIYNKALIKEGELPKNTDDILKMAATYNKAPDKYLFVYNAKNDAYAASSWFQAYGVNMVKPDGTTDLGNDASLKAAKLIKSFSAIMPAECDYGTMDALFKDGKAAMIINGPWAIADYQAKGIDIGLTTIPAVGDSGKPGTPFVGVKLLMLAANSKNPQAAVDVMKYYGSTDVQVQLAKINKQVPANTVAQAKVKDDPIIAAFIAQAANGRPMPNTEFISAMWDPFGKMIEAIWTGAATPEQAVKDGAALFAEKAKDLK
jgi:arabinogalactan oligomer/maltooligosaccharide transport system substrate-binding protein